MFKNIGLGNEKFIILTKPKKGAQMARSAGAYFRIMAKEDGLIFSLPWEK